MLNKYSNVFRSRWKAVGWAMGILMTAYCSVPSSDDTPSPVGAPQAPAAPKHAKNPWALDPKP